MTLRLKSILFLPIILFCAVTAAAQKNSVEGSVLSEGKPLPFATVQIGKLKMVADSLGRFTAQVEAGKQHVVVSMTGFEPLHTNIDIGHQLLQFELQPAQSSLSEVVITGTSKPVQRLQSPIAVEVYNPQFFKKNPTPSLFEAMQNVNGVRPQINCSVCNTGDIHINGLEGPYTMVTIDGMPIVSALSSVYGLFGIPNSLIERVEVVKGPASGLYGSEAIGGLINIITKSPDKAPLFTVNVMSTSWLEHNIDVGVKAKLAKRLTSLTGINYFHYQNPIDNNGDNFTDVTLQKRISVFNKFQLNRPTNRVASLAARYFYEDRWGGEMQWSKQFRGGDSVYGESIYTKRWELIGNYQLPVLEPMYFTFSATNHNQNSFYGKTPYQAKQSILFGQLKWDKNVGVKHELVTGLAARFTYYDDNSTATIDTLTKENAPQKTWVPGVFIQDEWKLSDRHRLLLGLRWDHHPVHGSIVTPRLAYKWGIKQGEVLRMNAGTGFRVVNLFTEDHAALTGARAVEIKEALQPEKSYNVNINYLRTFGSASKNFSVDASVWYTYFHNQIIANYDSDPNKIVYENLKGHAVSKGFSLNMECSWMQHLKGRIGITLQDVSITEKQGDKNVSRRPLLTESWSGTWALSYTFPVAGWTIDYTGNSYGPMKLPLLSPLDPRAPQSPVWSLQNIQLTKWVSKGIEVYGGVKNLLNWTPADNNPFLISRAADPFDKQVRYNNDGSVQAVNDPAAGAAHNPFGLTFDPSYIYAPNQGRRLFLGVRIQVK